MLVFHRDWMKYILSDRGDGGDRSDSRWGVTVIE